MSISFKYICAQCKKAFRFDNQCRCPMCGFIDAQICLSCHNNNHLRTVVMTISSIYFLFVGVHIG